MAYDKKFKERALAYWSEGHSHRETAKVFGIGTSTLKEWKKLQNEGKSLDPPRKRNRSPKKLFREDLTAYIEEHPDAYLSEIGEHFGCTSEGVRKALKRMGITRKKRQ